MRSYAKKLTILEHQAVSAIIDPPQTIFAPFDQRWEYPMVPAIGGLEKATRFSPDSGCMSIPLSRFRA